MNSTNSDMIYQSKLNYDAKRPLQFLLADRLKLLRKYHDLTQREVSQFLGVERSTYAYYELGNVKPDYILIAHLAGFYSISVDYLIGVVN